MNEGFDRELDELVLERLVDGELSEGEYRRVLVELETRPDGWRRCAMAFLEDQAWGCEVRSVRGQLEEPAVKSVVSWQDWSWKFGGILTLASAASFLFAFVLATMLLQSRYSSIGGSNVITAAADSHPSGKNAVTKPQLETGDTPDDGDEFVVDEGQPSQMAMPIFAADDPRGRILLNEQASMPLEVVRALQRSGYQVDRQRQWALGEEAGDSVLVPIEELHITPVSGRSYQ